MDSSIAQFTKGERPRPASVIAPLLYLGRSPDVPVSYVGTPPVGTPADNCEYVARSVVIHDARDTARLLALDRNGFELWQAPTTVGDFLDEDEVGAATTPRWPSWSSARREATRRTCSTTWCAGASSDGGR